MSNTEKIFKGYLVYSVTRMGYFWSVLVIIFRTKVAKIFRNFLAIFENVTSEVKAAVDSFGGNF